MELTNSFVRTNPEIAKHFARVTFFSDTRAELGFLTIPTLIVQSAHDIIAPLAVGHYINEQLADSRMVVVETGGHCPHLSAPQQTLARRSTISCTSKRCWPKAPSRQARHASATLSRTGFFFLYSPQLTAGG